MHSPGWLYFVGVSFIFGLIPGPSVCFTIAHAIKHGARRTLPTITGQLVANCCQILVVLFGLNRVVENSVILFQVLRIFGALYLIYLGYRQWTAGQPVLDKRKKVGDANAQRAFIAGFAVCGTNPKAIFYYAALLPQFVAPTHDENFQLMILAVTSVAIAASVLLFYTVLADRVSVWFGSRKYWMLQNRLAGFIMIIAGIALTVASK